MKKWRYKLAKPHHFYSRQLQGVSFQNEWIVIYPTGEAIISTGYAWDGCSPAIPVFDGMFWLGPPDGPLLEDGKPKTFYASLHHDVMCQFATKIPTTKMKVVRMFYEDLRKRKVTKLVSKVYASAVWLFGPRRFGSDL